MGANNKYPKNEVSMEQKQKIWQWKAINKSKLARNINIWE